MHHHAGRPIQLVQVFGRRGVHTVLVNGQRSQFDEPDTEAVAAAVSAQPPQGDEPLEHPVRRGPRQAGPEHDLGEAQPVPAVEGVEDERQPIENCARC